MVPKKNENLDRVIKNIVTIFELTNVEQSVIDWK